MKNIPLTNLVEQAVLDQMRAKASFTALDISNTLKFERYPVQHREVAEARARDLRVRRDGPLRLRARNYSRGDRERHKAGAGLFVPL